MRWTFFLSFLIQTVAAEPAAITIWVYNMAQLDEATLTKAKASATDALSRAGLAVTWIDCSTNVDEERFQPCRNLPESGGFVLRVRPGTPTESFLSADAFGYALLSDKGGFGRYANVYAGGAERRARAEIEMRPVILGYLMAHEIGHLLLKSSAHASSGLMTAHWGLRELRGANQGALRFSNKEVERIRKNLNALP